MPEAFKLLSQDGAARTGILKTAHYPVKTPFFMPIATKGAAKHISSEELKDAGTECIIANAFVLNLKPGLDVIKRFGGIHDFMNWDRAMFTDSGGFQMLSKEFLQHATEKGVVFKNPFDQSRMMITPEKAIEIENSIGADVAMCLDYVPEYRKDKAYIEHAVQRTNEWAERCKAAHNNDKQLLFGISQGGVYTDLRRKSARCIDSMDFDGVALGGLAIGEMHKDTSRMIKASLPEFDPAKARYVMGMGRPDEVLDAISQGVDIFDSRYPTQNARHRTLFTVNGNLLIDKAKFKLDRSPIEKGCDCVTCKNHSRAYIHHLFKTHEPIAMRYASVHNVRFIHRMIENARKAIAAGKFEKYRKSFNKSFRKGKA
ncbi:MAG TPA: tRNA guanosine(34) transglycosylase Tgt [Candidatus Nanoarchaeia archaeon]|nr:tRNA guanosine(34) transglycosylase Tgt [Candidatus Nanoarchaeia archaeon]